MNSGYMWCQIRKPQYAQVGHGGAVSYIAGGYQNQLGAEVHIVSAICEWRFLDFGDSLGDRENGAARLTRILVLKTASSGSRSTRSPTPYRNCGTRSASVSRSTSGPACSWRWRVSCSESSTRSSQDVRFVRICFLRVSVIFD